ncbi:MAG: phospholipase D family protein [bacterium]|nr:phospholipase D family protein [bacterium]
MFNSPLGSSAADRIDRFLNEHPNGALFVAVGYASVAGLAWLGERTVGRPVALIIGNAQASRFQKATAADKGAAVEFLRRRDVEVRNWYRTGRGGGAASDAHLKVWAVLGPGGHATAALVGSANLTRQGLFENVETCVEASDADLPVLRQQITALREAAWDCRESISCVPTRRFAAWEWPSTGSGAGWRWAPAPLR